MSILKADAVTAAQSNTDLSLSGSGTGGVKVTDYLVQTKGSDIASATALALGKDGNAFDVTGTTAITSIGTQGIGSHVTLQFDGVLTFTHHSTDLILPGAANITTAAGDIAVMYEYASGDWRCVSYTKASGEAVAAAGGGAWTLIGTQVADGSSSLTQTGLDSTYDTYAIAFSDFTCATNDSNLQFRVGDSSGVDSGGSDYDCHLMIISAGVAGYSGYESAATSRIPIARNPGNGTGEGVGALLFLHEPGDALMRPSLTGSATYFRSSDGDTARMRGSSIFGQRVDRITLDRVHVLFSGNNITTGRMTTWGISHT